jgi:DNA repair protein RAD5
MSSRFIQGTPIQNSLQDVYGLLKFLKHEPWCEAAFWKTAITKAASQKGDQSRGNESDDADVEVQEDGMKVAVERVRRVLNPLTLRRTKDTLTSEGEPILKLPPIDSSVVHVSLSEPERKFYKALLDKSVSQFEEFIVAGIESKSWLQIFSLLQRLRQACDHLALTVNPRISQDVLESSCTTIQTEFESKSGQANDTDEASAKDNFLDELLHTFNSNESNEIEDESGDKKSLTYSENMAHSLTQTINSNSLNLNDDCPICLDKPPKDDFAITPCAHVFCRKCIIETLNNTNVIKKDPESKIVRVGAVCSDGECPVCLTAVNASKIMFKSKVLKYPQDEKKCKENELKTILKKAMEGQRSSKILKMLNEMDIIWQKKPGSKIIIFSQFLGFLDLMEGTLRQEGIQYFRLDGSMSLKDRHNTITKFSTASKQHGGDSQGSILLASMRACGVGLNLVAASSVFIADPWWNAAIEDQCINRIHRIGQVAKEIFVRKFVVKDSVEEKIVNLQHRKKGMASEILSDKMAAVEMGSNQKSNPTMDDFRLMFRR